MKRNVCRILGCFLFAFTLCIMTPSFAKASVKNIPQTKTSGTYAGNVDITGDGNADSVIIRTTPDQKGWYINRFTIYLNGKRITEISLRDHDCYYLTVKYAKMSTPLSIVCNLHCVLSCLFLVNALLYTLFMSFISTFFNFVTFFNLIIIHTIFLCIFYNKIC